MVSRRPLLALLLLAASSSGACFWQLERPRSSDAAAPMAAPGELPIPSSNSCLGEDEPCTNGQCCGILVCATSQMRPGGGTRCCGGAGYPCSTAPCCGGLRCDGVGCLYRNLNEPCLSDSDCVPVTPPYRCIDGVCR